MATAYIVVEGSRSERMSQIAQLMAINEVVVLQPPDLRRSGLWPVEVHWLGKRKFCVLCLVGADAARSPLLAAHRDGTVPNCVRIFQQREGQETIGDVRASCQIPDLDFVNPPNEPFKYQQSTMGHAQRAQMASAIVEHALLGCAHLARALLAGAHPARVFDGFWNNYRRGKRTLTHSSFLEIRYYISGWKFILAGKHESTIGGSHGSGAQPADTMLLLRPAATTATAAAAADRCCTTPPDRRTVDCLAASAADDDRASTDTTATTDTDTASEASDDDDEPKRVMIKKLDDESVALKLDDLHRLFFVAGGSPAFGNIWAGGPSPVERRFFGSKDDQSLPTLCSSSSSSSNSNSSSH